MFVPTKKAVSYFHQSIDDVWTDKEGATMKVSMSLCLSVCLIKYTWQVAAGLAVITLGVCAVALTVTAGTHEHPVLNCAGFPVRHLLTQPRVQTQPSTIQQVRMFSLFNPHTSYSGPESLSAAQSEDSIQNVVPKVAFCSPPSTWFSLVPKHTVLLLCATSEVSNRTQRFRTTNFMPGYCLPMTGARACEINAAWWVCRQR